MSDMSMTRVFVSARPPRQRSDIITERNRRAAATQRAPPSGQSAHSTST